MKSKQSSKTDLQVVSIFKKAMSRLFMKRVGRQRLKLDSDRKRFHLKRHLCSVSININCFSENILIEEVGWLAN